MAPISKHLLLLVLLLTAAAAQAQTHAHHGTPAGSAMPPSATSPTPGKTPASLAPATAVAAFHRQMDSVMTVMDAGMQRMGGVPPTDIDASFAAMMVPHHQGAVDMARLQLLYGKDPELRRLAQSIIAEQQIEIQQMNAWLRRHAAAPTAPPAAAHH